MTNNNYRHYKQSDGSWTALVSKSGLEKITSSPNCPELWGRIKPGKRFIMKIRPLAEGIDYWCDRLNALRSINKELAFQAIDCLIAQQLIEIVWVSTGHPEQDAYVDREARRQYGVIFDR